MFFMKCVLKNLANAEVSLFGKETPTQVFFFEICVIFKNVFFNRTPPVSVSVILEEKSTVTISLREKKFQ